MALDPILDFLKSRTQPLHAQLEARVDILNRLQSREQYAELLAAFYGFYVPLEAKLAGCAALREARLDLQPRRKVPLLLADLQTAHVTAGTLPQAVDLPAISDASTALGCLYVVEGATLGSQIIKRLLAQQLAITDDNGGAFFNAYGDRVGDMWQAFRQTLSGYAAAHPGERERIVATAQETFMKLEQWFAQCFKRAA